KKNSNSSNLLEPFWVLSLDYFKFYSPNLFNDNEYLIINCKFVLIKFQACHIIFSSEKSHIKDTHNFVRPMVNFILNNSSVQKGFPPIILCFTTFIRLPKSSKPKTRLMSLQERPPTVF